jgi:hypothetical protein
VMIGSVVVNFAGLRAHQSLMHLDRPTSRCGNRGNGERRWIMRSAASVDLAGFTAMQRCAP